MPKELNLEEMNNVSGGTQNASKGAKTRINLEPIGDQPVEKLCTRCYQRKKMLPIENICSECKRKMFSL